MSGARQFGRPRIWGELPQHKKAPLSSDAITRRLAPKAISSKILRGPVSNEANHYVASLGCPLAM